VDASPKDPEGEGMLLVRKYKMKRAPFFIVEDDDGGVMVFDSVLRMLRDLFSDNNTGGEM
jgi:hypothetical protein